MIKVVHNVPELEGSFADTKACDVEENGTLVIYDNTGKYVRAAFAAGTWAGFQVRSDG